MCSGHHSCFPKGYLGSMLNRISTQGLKIVKENERNYEVDHVNMFRCIECKRIHCQCYSQWDFSIKNTFLHAQKWTTWSMLSTTCCNVVLHTVNNCCQQPLFTVVQSLLTTINKVFSSTIVSSCSNNIVTTIVLCQHRTTIDRTILINIVNSTSVVEPW